MSYIIVMKFEWNQIKSDKCYEERGFDFEYVIHGFFDPNRIIRVDSRYEYGEKRYQLICKIELRVFVVIFTYRSDVIRIISGRKANKREVRYYENTTSDR